MGKRSKVGDSMRVEIDCMNMPSRVYDHPSYYPQWVCSQLRESGIPIIGGPLLPKVDFSKGTLETWDDYATGKKIYIWRAK